ncbi:MAG: hypothetical protein OXK78_21130 [Caldilineaceae bacterium]|nr:hypothetical protein [Caldilineaceae bacterium]
MDSKEQFRQDEDVSSQESEIRWEEEEAELDYYERKFRLAEPTYRNPRMPKNERERFEMHRAEVQQVAEVADLESVWEITYTPARFEGGFLRTSLRPFYQEDQIVDVMAQVKGGKEANVYRCRAHESVDVEWIAAKVYRPRQFRNLRNDALYREGRDLLTAEDGRPQAVKRRDSRTARAVSKKSAFGVQVRHLSWLMYEFSALQTLHEAGVPVPKPYGVGENAILMEFIGDEQMAAPTLHETRLEDSEAGPLFERMRRSIAVMLEKGYVHGDLSAFNILYWDGEIKLIDFPQVIDIQANRSARAVLNRDVKRVCQYFSRYGIREDPIQLAEELWERYAAPDPDDLAADLSSIVHGEFGEEIEEEE